MTRSLAAERGLDARDTLTLALSHKGRGDLPLAILAWVPAFFPPPFPPSHPIIPALYPVIPAKAGIHRLADAAIAPIFPK